MATEEKKVGRPTDYTDELVEIICLRLAEGESLRSVCSDDGMPSKQAVLRWLARNEEFRAQYVRAKEEGAEAIAEELFDIADDGANDWMEKLDKDGECIGYQLNGEHVQRSKLRIDTRKWYLSKIMPKKYGDRIQHDQRITITDISDDELDRKITELAHAESQSGAED
ncbi:hypothetical protein [Yersinia frederiksenii]|uniref:DNA packaging protein n=1 Tax=Yersinia frederiksenii TaxID=29484 RepID=A0AAI8ZPU6_YERFR|nr:hypothetical protein [Yersinia frederiksenii]CFQ96007.1 Uncharacterised protein [Yersinia frederiksenii]